MANRAWLADVERRGAARIRGVAPGTVDRGTRGPTITVSPVLWAFVSSNVQIIAKTTTVYPGRLYMYRTREPETKHIDFLFFNHVS